MNPVKQVQITDPEHLTDIKKDYILIIYIEKYKNTKPPNLIHRFRSKEQLSSLGYSKVGFYHPASH